VELIQTRVWYGDPDVYHVEAQDGNVQVKAVHTSMLVKKMGIKLT